MRMVITDIEHKNNHIYVTGHTGIGDIKGEWCDGELPQVGVTYFFECSIGSIDKKEISVIEEKSFCSSVHFRDHQVQFRGICEEIDDVYVIRFCDDWMEMIDIDNDNFTIKKGDAVSFSVRYDRIGIYPYSL